MQVEAKASEESWTNTIIMVIILFIICCCSSICSSILSSLGYSMYGPEKTNKPEVKA